MTQAHQLSAIMFADIVGYTALMEDDEELALRLREKLKTKLKAEANLHKGRIIKFSGDGALCSFESAGECVRAALAVQTIMQEEPKVPLRIGIHQADVIFEESDVHGDGVNIASRLESLAVPGSIFISAKVYDDIKNQKDIQTVSLGKYLLKNVKEPMEIFVISNSGLQVPIHKKLEGKGIKYATKKLSIDRKAVLVRLGLVIFALTTLGYLFIPPILKIQKARNEWIPEIQKMAEANFLPPTSAFDLAMEAEKYVPHDSALLKLWPLISFAHSIQTEPTGADVYWKDYNDINGDWKFIGKTPLKNAWMPKGFPRIKIEKNGFKTVYNPGIFFPTTLKLKLDSIGKYPENMVKVSESTSHMLIVGLEKYGGEQEKGIYVNEFLMDKYEVTNKDFKTFVDSGGFNNKKYWDYPVYAEGKEIPWEKAMELFHDKTGKRSPADWEVGTYPEGKDNYPVTGISWYEAMAYAKFVGKTLPTVFHWSLIANTWSMWEIIPRSNFSGKGTVPVGSLNDMNFWGTYNVAGNVREWCFNETDKKGWRYILGGGWNDPTYAYNDAFSQSASDRSMSNGFRCMKQLPGDTTFDKLSGILKLDFRDYKTEKPVDDKTFNIFLRQYHYDHSPLNATVTTIADSSLCKIEKIDIDAAYNKERMTLYLFLPKNVSPPYQTIVIFPGSGVIDLRKFDFNNEMPWYDFSLKSGRALCYPVLKGTFERGDELRSDLPNESIFYKNHVINWVQDISRSLDYLETRKDIAHNGFGYFGVSWGSAEGPIVCAIEKRIKAAVFHVGGLCMENSLPEVDVFNFLPRVKIPVLMLNGKNDTFFPLETSQKPLFNSLGTAEKDKKMIVYPGGHLVPRSEGMKESLIWFDKYLGPVK